MSEGNPDGRSLKRKRSDVSPCHFEQGSGFCNKKMDATNRVASNYTGHYELALYPTTSPPTSPPWPGHYGVTHYSPTAGCNGFGLAVNQDQSYEKQHHSGMMDLLNANSSELKAFQGGATNPTAVPDSFPVAAEQHMMPNAYRPVGQHFNGHFGPQYFLPHAYHQAFQPTSPGFYSPPHSAVFQQQHQQSEAVVAQPGHPSPQRPLSCSSDQRRTYSCSPQSPEVPGQIGAYNESYGPCSVDRNQFLSATRQGQSSFVDQSISQHYQEQHASTTYFPNCQSSSLGSPQQQFLSSNEMPEDFGQRTMLSVQSPTISLDQFPNAKPTVQTGGGDVFKMAPGESVADRYLESELTLSNKLSLLHFHDPVTYIYNPLEFALDPHKAYIARYLKTQVDVLFLGMNPGSYGMVQTGVPFGEVSMVKTWLDIAGTIEKPTREHPKRPVLGFECSRSEVSGFRFWSFLKRFCSSPDVFFQRCFVHNFCPIVFLTDTGKNVTPADLPAAERNPLNSICAQSLCEIVRLLKVKVIVGVGKYATDRARAALQEKGDLGHVRVESVMHPSPANPAANRGWDVIVEKQLGDLGILHYLRS